MKALGGVLKFFQVLVASRQLRQEAVKGLLKVHTLIQPRIRPSALELRVLRATAMVKMQLRQWALKRLLKVHSSHLQGKKLTDPP